MKIYNYVILDKLILFFTLIYIFQLGRLEKFGSISLIIYFIVICFYVFYNFFFNKNYYLNLTLLLWILISIIYIFFSFLEILPGNRRVFYEDQIFRTCYFIFLSYPVITSSYIFFSKFKNLTHFKNESYIFFLLIIFLLCLNIIFPIYDDWWMPESQSYSFLEILRRNLFKGTSNIFIFSYFFILLYLYQKKILSLILFLLIGIFSMTTQLLLLSILLIFILFFNLNLFLKNLFIAIIILLFFLPFISFETNDFIRYFYSNDPNIYTRLSRIFYSLKALYSNLLFGLGYGADSINDIYAVQELNTLWGQGKYTNAKLILIHNSIIYIFYSTGLFGGILFLYYFFKNVFPKLNIEKSEQKFSLYLFSIIYISLMTNTALESPNYSISLFWIIGFLVNLNEKKIN